VSEQAADLVPSLEVPLVAELHGRARLRAVLVRGRPGLAPGSPLLGAPLGGPRGRGGGGGGGEAGAHGWSWSPWSPEEEVEAGFGGWELRIGWEAAARGRRRGI
jgi:hypothetical protein